MAEVLNLIYSVLILAIAGVGVVYALWATPNGRDGQTRLRSGLVAAAVVLFLLVMIGALVV